MDPWMQPGEPRPPSRENDERHINVPAQPERWMEEVAVPVEAPAPERRRPLPDLVAAILTLAVVALAFTAAAVMFLQPE